MSATIAEIEEIDYHRNGISGEGFHAVRFRADDGDHKLRHFLGIVFEESGYCAVICLDYLPMYGVDTPNHWRGDVFETELRKCIKRAEKRTNG